MLLAASANQQNFHYGQEEMRKAAQDFSSDEADEEVQAVDAQMARGDHPMGTITNSSMEEGELDSAQKQKLRRELFQMGYGEDDDFEDEEETAHAFIAGGDAEALDPRRLMMM